MRLSQPASVLLRNIAVGLQTGADPSVLTNSFDVQAYATSRGFGTIPAETGPTQEPIADQGAVGNGIADDTTEVVAALNALPSTGGVLDLSQGIFGLSGTDDILNIGNKSNITIKGGGWDQGSAQTSGLRVLSHTSANRFDAAIRYNPGGNNQNLVVRDLEIDGNDQQAGGITIQDDMNSWIIQNFVHDIGDGGAGSAAAAIRGADVNTTLRVIGNVVQRTSAAGSSGVRGIWMSEAGPLDSVYAHNITTDTGHTGLPVHVASTTPETFVEFNTCLRGGLFTGAACMKSEMSNTVDVTTYDVPGVFTTFRRNYADDEKSISGNTDAPLQSEAMNLLIEENIFRDALRGVPSFDRSRKVTIQNNVFELMDEYGIYVEAQGIAQDHTGLIFLNNTISADGQSMDTGIFFLANFTGAIFGFGDPIQIADNRIIGASGPDVVTTAALDAYVAGDPSSFITNNNSSAPGAANVLLPPPYIGSI